MTRAPAVPAGWAPTDPLRLRAVLMRLGISLTDVGAVTRHSKSTWSRMLAGKKPLHADPAERAAVEELVRAKEPTALVPDLWLPAPPEPDAPQPERIVMQKQVLHPDAQRWFKLFRDPFDADAILQEEGGDVEHDLFLPRGHDAVLLAMVHAMTRAGMIAVFGAPGSGKTTLRSRAFRRAAEIKQIRPLVPPNIERRRLTSSHISDEIIRQLGDNGKVPSNTNRRDWTAIEILRRRYVAGERVVLSIDEAHELPSATLHDLKRWGEVTAGEGSYGRLLSIVLLGHEELGVRLDMTKTPHLQEFSQRVQVVRLPPMVGEVAGFLSTRFGWVSARLEDVFSADAVAAVESRLGAHGQQYPLLAMNLAVAAMNLAWSRSNRLVDEDDVVDALTARGGLL